MWPAEAYNLARETPNFASFFDKKHPLNVLKHNNFGPWMCGFFLARNEIWAVNPWFNIWIKSSSSLNIQFQILNLNSCEDEASRRESEQKTLTHESWLKLEEELRDLHELITTFSATPAVTVLIQQFIVKILYNYTFLHLRGQSNFKISLDFRSIIPNSVQFHFFLLILSNISMLLGY